MKSKVLVLFAICCLLLAGGCENGMDMEQAVKKPGLPPSTGSVSVYIEGQNARTILPGAPAILKYKLALSSDTNDFILYRTPSNLSDPINLKSGTYKLHVIAYLDDNGLNEDQSKPAAWGEAAGIVINSGVGVDLVITLTPYPADGEEYDTGTGEGTFRWDITWPNGLASASITVTPLDAATGTAAQTLAFTAGAASGSAGGLSLKSGYYNVLFVFEKPGYQTLEWLEILHIYQNLVSVYTKTFGDEYFNNENHIVTFNFNDGITGDGTLSHVHGELIDISLISDPGRDGYAFGCWYADNGAWDTVTDKWNFAARRLSRSLTLYAKWVPKPKLALPATVNFNAIYGYTSGAEGQTVTINNTWLGTAKVTDIQLGGVSAGLFTLSGDNLIINSNIAPGGSASFTLLPTDGLNVSTYGAEITVTYEGVEIISDGISFSDTAGANTVSFVVNPKPITISGVTALSKTYDGTASAAAGMVTFSGLVGSETFTLDTDYTVTAVFTGGNFNAGSGNRPYTYTVTMLSTAAANNYNLTPNTRTGTNGTINKANPAVNWPADLTAIYGQTLADVTLPGNGAGTPGAFSWAAAVATDVGNAGTQPHGLRFTPADGANYNTVSQDVNVTVGKIPPTVTRWPVQGNAITYGAELSTLTLINGIGAGTFAWTDGSIIPTVTNSGYQVTFTPTDNENYSTLTQTVSVGVNPKPVTIIGVTANDKVYDGNGTASFSAESATIDGNIDGNNLTINASGATAAFSSKDAGARTVTFSGFALGGSAMGNYTLSARPASVSASITAKALTLSVTNPSRTTFTPLEAETTATITLTPGGIVSGETPPLTYTAPTGFTLSGSTLTYNGTTAFTNPSATLSFTVTTTNTNYSDGTGILSVTIYDGQADYTGAADTYDRRIPVTKSNIRTFNIYANTTAGLTRHYKLTENIIASDLPANLGGRGNWTAIGDYSSRFAFAGTFDGQGNTVSGLNIYNSSGSPQGMFAYTGTSTEVRNLGLLNCSISGYNRVGGMVGINYGALTKCYVTGSVTCIGVSGHNGRVGGIAGENDGMVQYCYTTCSVNSLVITYYDGGVGGLVGYNGGSVVYCYSTGNIGGINNTNAGGIAGINDSLGMILHCYATGDVIVSGKSDGAIVYNSGGIVGVANRWVMYCYTTGSVRGSSCGTGGIGSTQYARDCVALNPSVTTFDNLDLEIYGVIGRICPDVKYGFSYTFTYIRNNYARKDMRLAYNNGGTVYTPIYPPATDATATLNSKDGVDITSAEWNSASWWTTASNWDTAAWDTNIWDIADGRLPILKGMPPGEQNPVVAP